MADPSPSQIAGWLEQAQLGDAAARDQLFGACRSFVAITARVHLQRRLQSKVDASDLAQQSLLEAHRGFERFAGQSPQEWFGWLKQIVVHNAADVAKQYRGTAKRDAGREISLAAESSNSAAWDHTPPDPGPSPSQVVAGMEQELLMAAAIEQLPDDYREVLILRHLERLPFQEVAERMGRSRGACQMLWARAMEQLKGLMSQTSQATREPLPQ
ncbi:sigma-70 family RNA polymerase sigma factor [bacterium]|nr:sigma-70 family RNA polymerase sigma factor [bacterium]